QRTADEVAAVVPAGVAGADLGAAPFARAETRGLGRRRVPVEAHVARCGGAARADGPAVDARGEHRGVKPAVEARIPGADRPVAGVEVEPDAGRRVHATDNTRRSRG